MICQGRAPREPLASPSRAHRDPLLRFTFSDLHEGRQGANHDRETTSRPHPDPPRDPVALATSSRFHALFWRWTSTTFATSFALCFLRFLPLVLYIVVSYQT